MQPRRFQNELTPRSKARIDSKTDAWLDDLKNGVQTKPYEHDNSTRLANYGLNNEGNINSSSLVGRRETNFHSTPSALSQLNNS